MYIYLNVVSVFLRDVLSCGLSPLIYSLAFL